MSWAFVFFLFLVIVVTIKIYNHLVSKRNETSNAFAQIDVQLTRRYELIPNLVAVAKKYLQHEKDTLTQVISARNHAAQMLKAGKIAPLAQAEGLLGQQLGALYATFENYPDLKADQQLNELREEIISSENRVAFARQYFNDCVTEYNDSLQQFPNNLIGGVFQFKPIALLAFDDMELKRQPIKVSFN